MDLFINEVAGICWYFVYLLLFLLYKLDKSGRNNYLNFKFAITKKIKKRCFKVLILGIAKFLKFEFIIHRKEINVKI